MVFFNPTSKDQWIKNKGASLHCFLSPIISLLLLLQLTRAETGEKRSCHPLLPPLPDVDGSETGRKTAGEIGVLTLGCRTAGFTAILPGCLVKPEEASLSLCTHLEEFGEQSLFWQLKIYCSFVLLLFFLKKVLLKSGMGAGRWRQCLKIIPASQIRLKSTSTTDLALQRWRQLGGACPCPAGKLTQYRAPKS